MLPHESLQARRPDDLSCRNYATQGLGRLLASDEFALTPASGLNAQQSSASSVHCQHCG
jgi:hypothetical protein